MKYAILTIKHKWFVLLAGLKTKAPLWRLLIHDWSKFTPSELPHYQRQFFGKEKSPTEWARCWVHHQNTNPHHWEYWIDRSGFPICKAVTMPWWAVREMIADWMAACRAYEGYWPTSERWPWFEKNGDRIYESVDVMTEIRIRNVLKEVGLG